MSVRPTPATVFGTTMWHVIPTQTESGTCRLPVAIDTTLISEIENGWLKLDISVPGTAGVPE